MQLNTKRQILVYIPIFSINICPRFYSSTII